MEEEFLNKFARMAHCHVEHSSLADGSASDKLRRCNPRLDHEFDNDESDDEMFFTGAQLEHIIADAFRIASSAGSVLCQTHLLAAFEDYIPPVSMLEYDNMSALAISFANSYRFIPKSGRWAKKARDMGVVTKIQKQQAQKMKFSDDDE